MALRDPDCGSCARPVHCHTKAIRNPETRRLSIHVNLDSALQEDLLAELQAIESLFGYYFNLTRIHWRFATASIICETPEEEQQVQVNHWRIAEELFDIPTEFELDRFNFVLSIVPKCQDLAGTLAFYREGANDLRNMRYISAFFNFYFVLEGLYANGKTKNRQVLHEFKRSKVLTRAIEEAIANGFPRPYRLDKPTVERMLKQRAKPCDPEGIIHLFVWTRGDLHHFANRPGERGSPLTDDNYECLAKFAIEVCKRALFGEIQNRLSTG